MYRLYSILNNRTEPPTDEERLFACRKKALVPAVDAQMTAELVRMNSESSIAAAFSRQRQKNKVIRSQITMQKAWFLTFNAIQEPWDQVKFDNLLAEWIVACDQPFEEVDRPEFRRLIQFAHGDEPLSIPHRKAMKEKIVKMGAETLESIKSTISVGLFSSDAPKELSVDQATL